MSTSMLKKSLELVDTEFVQKHTVIHHKKEGKKIFSEIRLKKKARKVKNSRSVADIKPGNVNSVVKVKKQLNKKTSQEEINRKLKILHRTPDANIVKKLMSQLGYGDKTKQKSTEDQKTAFTEEDFLKFEKEYIDTN